MIFNQNFKKPKTSQTNTCALKRGQNERTGRAIMEISLIPCIRSGRLRVKKKERVGSII